MASTEAVKEEAGTAVSGKQGLALLPVLLIVLGAMVVVLLAAGGAGFWLLKSGKLGTAPATAREPVATVEDPAVKGSLVLLDPLLVNLADADKRSYLRITVTLRVEERSTAKAASSAEEKPAKGKPVNKDEAEEEDALLEVLGRQTADDLLAPDGKDQLKVQMLSALRKRLPEVTFKDVLFTEFLVQR